MDFSAHLPVFKNKQCAALFAAEIELHISLRPFPQKFYPCTHPLQNLDPAPCFGQIIAVEGILEIERISLAPSKLESVARGYSGLCCYFIEGTKRSKLLQPKPNSASIFRTIEKLPCFGHRKSPLREGRRQGVCTGLRCCRMKFEMETEETEASRLLSLFSHNEGAGSSLAPCSTGFYLT